MVFFFLQRAVAVASRSARVPVVQMRGFIAPTVSRRGMICYPFVSIPLALDVPRAIFDAIVIRAVRPATSPLAQLLRIHFTRLPPSPEQTMSSSIPPAAILPCRTCSPAHIFLTNNAPTRTAHDVQEATLT